MHPPSDDPVAEGPSVTGRMEIVLAGGGRVIVDRAVDGSALARVIAVQQSVEPMFGIIKAVLGFTGFSLRGLDKAADEWDLVALAYNCKRLHKLKLATAS